MFPNDGRNVTSEKNMETKFTHYMIVLTLLHGPAWCEISQTVTQDSVSPSNKPEVDTESCVIRST